MIKYAFYRRCVLTWKGYVISGEDEIDGGRGWEGERMDLWASGGLGGGGGVGLGSIRSKDIRAAEKGGLIMRRMGGEGMRGTEKVEEGGRPYPSDKGGDSEENGYRTS